MPERKTHLLVAILGTTESAEQTTKLLNVMRRHFTPHGFLVGTHKMGWKDQRGGFKQGLDRLQSRIERVRAAGRCDYASAIGPSAGGITSAALSDVFPELTAAVAISAPLNPSATPQDAPSRKRLQELGQEFPVFSEAIDVVTSLDWGRARNIMTLNPQSGDDIVPLATGQINGADNRVIPYAAKDHSDGARYISRNPTVMLDVVTFLRTKEND